jgi:hypothetical protein
MIRAISLVDFHSGYDSTTLSLFALPVSLLRLRARKAILTGVQTFNKFIVREMMDLHSGDSLPI